MAAIELSNIAAGAGGFVINGECKDDLAGYSVAAAGDVNGDALDVLVVGAWAVTIDQHKAAEDSSQSLE